VAPNEQGKSGKRGASARAEAARARRAGQQRLGLFGLAIVLVASFAIVAAAQGIGGPSLDDGEVAIVEEAPDGAITQEDFDRALAQTAARQGLREVPPTDDPQYELLADAALSDLILARWVAGEAEERGIEASDREVEEELTAIKDQQFGGSEKQFQRFLEQSGFTEEEARERIELQLVSDEIQRTVLPEDPPITEEEIETFYEENLTQFERPETRDVRVILTKREPEAEEALSRLERDDSAQSFKAVARDLSIDEATKSTGGLRQGVIEGQSDPALDEQIFGALQGDLVGPFETDAGFYVIQVQSINTAETTPLDEATDQVRQTLVAARQQELADTFQQDFTAQWTSRTFCDEDYRIDRCENAEPPADPCTEELATTQGCDAPVPSTRPIAPGTAGVFGAPAAPGLPQGPVTPVAAQPPGGLPPGLTPLPGGAVPGATPGAAPPGTAPPGTAPPGG
jgi:parvulin-like peptidyl-prolyl isomerase